MSFSDKLPLPDDELKTYCEHKQKANTSLSTFVPQKVPGYDSKKYTYPSLTEIDKTCLNKVGVNINSRTGGKKLRRKTSKKSHRKSSKKQRKSRRARKSRRGRR